MRFGVDNDVLFLREPLFHRRVKCPHALHTVGQRQCAEIRQQPADHGDRKISGADHDIHAPWQGCQRWNKHIAERLRMVGKDKRAALPCLPQDLRVFDVHMQAQAAIHARKHRRRTVEQCRSDPRAERGSHPLVPLGDGVVLVLRLDKIIGKGAVLPRFRLFFHRLPPRSIPQCRCSQMCRSAACRTLLHRLLFSARSPARAWLLCSRARSFRDRDRALRAHA